MEKSFKDLLIKLGISTENSIRDFHPRVRDTEEVSVLKCDKSGVYFLSNNDFSSEQVYKNNDGFDYWKRDWDKTGKVDDRKVRIFEDDHRRVEQLKNEIHSKRWLDFGCGSGGALRVGKDNALEAVGLEIQPGPRQCLNEDGIRCVESLDEFEDNHFDLITLFHVYEHIQNPIEILDAISKKLAPGGRLVVEVPQANDILLSLFDLEAFKDFTFWSEHLILHTRESLSQFIGQCDSLELDSIQGFQRFPLSNHLHWLAKSLPGGHEKWSFLNNDTLKEAYAKTLQSVDKTDTIIAYIRKK